jgi:hypothetical protein
MSHTLIIIVLSMTAAALCVFVGIACQQFAWFAAGLGGLAVVLLIGLVLTFPTPGPSVDQRGVLALVLDKQFDRSCSINGTSLPSDDQNVNCFEAGDFRVWYEQTDKDVRYYVAKFGYGVGDVTLSLIFDRDAVLRGDVYALSYVRTGLDWADLRTAFIANGGKA